MSKRFLSFVFVLLGHLVFGQSAGSTFTINTVIIDTISGKPMPFTPIHKMRDRKGAISNFNGLISLNNVRPDDTLVITSIGYEKKKIIGESLRYEDTIFLVQEAQLVNQVIILAKDAFLYELIAKAKKRRTPKTLVAKTYFELETFEDDERMELFQAYYNGKYSGYNVSSLDMKNGRTAISPISKRYFMSTESSKAMYMHKLLNENDYFPKSPFEIKNKNLRKTYRLNLQNKYKDDLQNTVYVIGFTPKTDTSGNFSGEVWIDSANHDIVKVNLRLKNASVSPFMPTHSLLDLKQIDLEISKTFEQIKGTMYVKSIDFKYNFIFETISTEVIKRSTRAILYAYKYDDEFMMPFFDFDNESMYADYAKVIAMPANPTFWQCFDEFKVKTDSHSKNTFIEDSSTIDDVRLFSTFSILPPGFYEGPYVQWNGNRIVLKEYSMDTNRYKLSQGTIPAQRYHLKAQIFFDVNELCDSTQIITKTIFDPDASYYSFPSSKSGTAFINIYFDLIEIQRRVIDAKLRACGDDIDQMKVVYHQSMEDVETLSAKFFKEVQHGTNREELVKWNDYIKEELNIDNVFLFRVYDDENDIER